MRILMTDVDAEILLHGEIGPWDVTSKAFSKEVAKAKGLPLHVRINSPGGDYHHGLGMYNYLMERKAPVKVTVDAIAASAASIVAMAGSERLMAQGAQMMLHEPWGMIAGNASVMREQADRLDRYKASATDVYSKRTGQDAADIEQMMAAETWMDGEEAMRFGFATGQVSTPAIAASISDRALKWYRNPPIETLMEWRAEVEKEERRRNERLDNMRDYVRNYEAQGTP